MEHSIRFRAVFPALVGLWFAFASAAVEEHPGQSQDHTIRSLLHSRAKVDRRGEGNDYVSNEILIKFRQEAAEKLAFGLQQGKPIHQIQITRSLDVVNQKYGAKTIGKLFGRFREDQENIKSLRRKFPALLLHGHFLSEIVASKEIKENSGNVQFRLKHYTLRYSVVISLIYTILLRKQKSFA